MSRTSSRELERLLNCPVRFEAAANGIMLSLEEAQARCRVEDCDLITVLERHLIDVTRAQGLDNRWRDRAISLIATYLGQQPVTIDRLAADLATSPRSLQRHLAAEGTSLRELLRAHRQELARHHLRSGETRLGNLAEALGYTDGTSFWRAYRSWTGHSPSSARADAASGEHGQPARTNDKKSPANLKNGRAGTVPDR